MKTFSLVVVPTLLVALLPAALARQPHGDVREAPTQTADSAAVVAVIGDFHDALSRGDGAGALALLAPGARVIEGGGIETVEEYASHHLPADMAFASAVERVRDRVQVVVRGDVAWATSTSRTTGAFRGREIDSQGAELVVLSRTDEGWWIEAIHWSSR